ncbi:MAG: 5-deoxy-glucuronate isomerase [Armatimonadetes bacterium]|nr:5-deoxy-glucuronate isomerase [Armatimonadota bacterium]
MNGYHLRTDLQPGLNHIRQASHEAGELLDFWLWRAAAAGEEVCFGAGDKEFAVVVMSGTVDVVAGENVFRDLGGRHYVFSGPATGVYVPPGLGITIRSRSCCEVAVCAAPSDAQGPPSVIKPADVTMRKVGRWNWTRDVHTIIGPNVPHARRLVVGETYNLPGNWSSYPPHRHIQDDYPFEVRMEEIYHFRVFPPGGFGIQCLYNDDLSLDEAYVVRDGDTVVIPPSYHPVAAAPGYQVYYLWMLAAYTDRRLKPRDDPAHAWVHAAGEMARGMGF